MRLFEIESRHVELNKDEFAKIAKRDCKESVNAFLNDHI